MYFLVEQFYKLVFKALLYVLLFKRDEKIEQVEQKILMKLQNEDLQPLDHALHMILLFLHIFFHVKIRYSPSQLSVQFWILLAIYAFKMQVSMKVYSYSFSFLPIASLPSPCGYSMDLIQYFCTVNLSNYFLSLILS